MVSVRYVYAILLQNCILIKNCLKICDDLFVVFLIYFYKNETTSIFSLKTAFSTSISHHCFPIIPNLSFKVLLLHIFKRLLFLKTCEILVFIFFIIMLKRPLHCKGLFLLHHLLCSALKNRLNFCHHEVNRHMILAAFWDDDIGVPLCWFNELIMHGSDNRYILFNDRID